MRIARINFFYSDLLLELETFSGRDTARWVVYLGRMDEYREEERHRFAAPFSLLQKQFGAHVGAALGVVQP
jgi:hypothetical protein